MARIVDLSVAIENFMPSHRAMPRPVFRPYLGHEESLALGLGTPEDPFTSAMEFVAMVTHIGTHVDAFFHTNPDGATIDEMPLELFQGRAVALDLRHIPDLGTIDVADLEAAEKQAGVTIEGHIVLLNTGLHARHYPNESVMVTNPGLSPEATHWLADRGSVLHGVEGPSTDRPDDPTFPSHRVCRDRGLAHYEWLCNLEQLLGRGTFRFQGFPLNLHKASGSPVRALAFLD